MLRCAAGTLLAALSFYLLHRHLRRKAAARQARKRSSTDISSVEQGLHSGTTSSSLAFDGAPIAVTTGLPRGGSSGALGGFSGIPSAASPPAAVMAAVPLGPLPGSGLPLPASPAGWAMVACRTVVELAVGTASQGSSISLGACAARRLQSPSLFVGAGQTLCFEGWAVHNVVVVHGGAWKGGLGCLLQDVLACKGRGGQWAAARGSNILQPSSPPLPSPAPTPSLPPLS